LASAYDAGAQTSPKRFDIPAGDLADALNSAARTANVSLLFDRSRVQTRRSPAVHLTGTPQEVFAALLAGTGLVMKPVSSQSYIMAPADPQPAVADPIVTVPELLVVGHNSQNVDIERRASDIQPYRILSSGEISDFHADTSEELLRSEIASNELTALSSQDAANNAGGIRSSIDLRGLGTQETLVLVDGRRLPSAPLDFDFYQGDINGLPPAAIERVEVLSGTAGGLYGPGATGGVVNIVLKQSFPGLWIQSQGGVDQRGDGEESRVEGGFSWASPSGVTRFSVVAGFSQDEGLTFGDRSFVEEARERLGALLFDYVPDGQNVNVRSVHGAPLVLLSKYGGQSLGSNITNFPVNAGGPGGNLAALAEAGAGSFDNRLSDDGSGSEQTLVAPDRTHSIIANLHQDLGSRVELFGNMLDFADEGFATVPTIDDSQFLLQPGQDGNPFKNTIYATTPYPGASGADRTTSETLRATAGIIAHLAHEWSLEADATIGTSSLRQIVYEPSFVSPVDVFSPGNGLADAMAGFHLKPQFGDGLTNTMQDYNLRLAGPLAKLPSGPLTMTLVAESRNEVTPAVTETGFDLPPSDPHRENVASLVDELRLPLVAKYSDFVLLRGLELQIAVRADRYIITAPQNIFEHIPGDSTADVHSSQTTLASTLGAKATPVDGLTLRASYASGYLPPTVGEISPTIEVVSDVLDDPKRLGSNSITTYRLSQGGTPDLEPELARTFSIGFILQPRSLEGLRASVDYTRIEQSNEITGFALGFQDFFLAHEGAFPGHVIRAPLTPSDAALGYTGGVVKEIDATYLNTGHTVVQAVDFDVGYTRDLPWGRIHLHGTATWEPSFLRTTDPFAPALQTANYAGGPLGLKGDIGAEWSRGPLSASLNAQYFGSYYIADGDYPGAILYTEEQGSRTIPSQTYLDLGLAYRTPAPSGGNITYQIAIKDIFDALPPIVVPLQNGSEGGYSFYGDPRGRRFIALVSLSF
jgi:iron complex outermembrane receptor protein